MGIPATVRLLKTVGRYSWSGNLRLRDCNVVIDVTQSMFWFVKSKLFEGHSRPDRFGFSVVKYAQFFRNFFEHLKSANVNPIIVYDGAGLSERKYGPMVSKSLFNEKSARIRMFKLNRHGKRIDDTIMPLIATTALKQVINELSLQHEPVQSVYEVYPKLVQLAERYNCPVITSHTDFIFCNVRQGFIWAEEFQPNEQLKKEIPCTVYLHQKMLSQYGLVNNSGALHTLHALLRPDFSGRYFMVLNKLFGLANNSRLRIREDKTRFVLGARPVRQPCYERLAHIISNWQKTWRTPDDVRRELVMSGATDEMMKDYDALYSTFSEPLDFDQEVRNLIPPEISLVVNVSQALTKREASSHFIMDILMEQKNINRGCVEDLETYRSTYSLADPYKLFIMEQARIKRLNLLDRRYSELELRSLVSTNDLRLNVPGDQMIYELCRFPRQLSNRDQMKAFLKTLQVGKALIDDYAEQLIVILMLAHLAFQSAFIESYDNPPPPSSPSKPSSPTKKGSSASLHTSSVDIMAPNREKYRKQYQNKFFSAIYNMFMFYCHKHQKLDEQKLNTDPSLIEDPGKNGSTAREGFFPQIRLAAGEIERIERINSDISEEDYLKKKHLVEMLNSVVHSYCEMNALYNYPGVRLRLGDYYDCTIVYKLLGQPDKKSKSSLLRMEKALESLLGMADDTGSLL